MMDCESKKTTFEKTSVVTELSPMMQQIRIGIEKRITYLKLVFVVMQCELVMHAYFYHLEPQ